MRKRLRQRDRMAASAFRDAVRHILAEEGVFTLADHRDPRRFWSWNGAGWREELLPVEGTAGDALQPGA
jgi:hypothetical protein